MVEKTWLPYKGLLTVDTLYNVHILQATYLYPSKRMMKKNNLITIYLGTMDISSCF